MVQLLFNHKIQIGESYIGRLFAVIKKKLGIRDACIRILPVPDRTASIGGGGAVIRGYFFSFLFFSRMARALGAVWPLVKGCLAGGVVGITVADWWASIVTMDGASLHPAFDSQQAARALVEKRCLYRYDFSRGDVVVLRQVKSPPPPPPPASVSVGRFLDWLVVDVSAVARRRSPRDHRELVVKRLIALPGDWIQIPEKQEIRQIPQGHCWVEGDNATLSFDSRSYGPVSIRLVTGHKCVILA